MAAMTRIKWYPPLDSVKGPETEIDLDGPTAVAALLRRLCAEDPGLSRFAQVDADSNLVLGLMVLMGDTLLRSADTVEPGAHLEILAAIDGG